MKLNKVWTLFFCGVFMAFAAVSQAASMAFVGFNADGTDGYSLATFEDITSGTQINFTDDEWNGTAFIDSNEADWSWTATSDVLAGTVINFIDMANIYSGNPVASATTGTVAGITVGGSNAGYSNSAEVIYAFTGTRTAPTFLAAISSDSAGNFSFGGLTGAQAVQIGVGSDGAKYTGPREGKSLFSEYLPLIAGYPANWSDVGSGTGDNNFDPTSFSTIPEPTTFSLIGITFLALAYRRTH